MFIEKFLALKSSLQSRADISDLEFEMLIKLATFKQWEKGEHLTEIGQTEQYVYFIVEGMTRSHFYKDERDISLDFHFTGDFVSVLESFVDRTPAEHAIEALVPTSTLRIFVEDLQGLYAQSAKFEHVGRIVTEEQFKKSSGRVKDLLSLTATERYVKLLEAHPNYVQQLPLKYLASYLNITPESLSRIRKNRY